MADRCRWWVGLGVAAAVVLVGCGGGGGGGDEAGVARPGGGEPSTGVATTAPSTTAPPSTTVAGEPRVTATPSRGPAGTRVRIEGDGFTGDPWQTGGGDLWLTEAPRQGGCDLVARTEHDVHVSAAGHLTGIFVVPATGECRFSAGGGDTGPLRYDIAYQCTACAIGAFTVILPGESMEEPTGERCDATVAFGVQNVAIDIVVDGLTCETAEAFVRDHARPWQPLDSPLHVEADGFTCNRTGLSDAALPPRANYKCVNGGQIIFFIRT